MASHAHGHHFRPALTWSALSVAWTVVASTSATAIGIATGSMLLVVFGLIGVLDLVGSLVLIFHFRHGVRHGALRDHWEERAVVVIAAGMGAIGLGTLVESVHRLVGGSQPSSSAVGLMIVGVSAFVLAFLATGKRRVGLRIDSPPLVADSHVSMMGAAIAAFTVAGSAAATHLSWWWLDPIGSLLVAGTGTAVAVHHVRAR